MKDKWGVASTPLAATAAFTLCVATLKELGATGNKARAAMLPVA